MRDYTIQRIMLEDGSWISGVYRWPVERRDDEKREVIGRCVTGNTHCQLRIGYEVTKLACCTITETTWWKQWSTRDSPCGLGGA